MTLDQQMLKAIEKARYEYGGAVGGSEDSFIAHETAKIALEIAERAYGMGWCKGHNDGIGYEDDSTFEDFKKTL